MPVPSKAAARFWRFAEEHPQEAGVKKATADEFVQSMHGQRIRDLPERVAKKAEGGAVDGEIYPRIFRW